MIRPLRRKIDDGSLVPAPRAGDASGTLPVETSGFACVPVSGRRRAAALGHPDMGSATLSRMAAAGRISDAVPIPVVADADNGRGNAVDVIRTMRELGRARVRPFTSKTGFSPRNTAISTTEPEVLPEA